MRTLLRSVHLSTVLLLACVSGARAIIELMFNTFMPLLLRDGGLSASAIGFVMTIDNYLFALLNPFVGSASDRQTRFGRRKPWVLVGGLLAALMFALIPLMSTIPTVILTILLLNAGLTLLRPSLNALLGDLFPPDLRSTANGVISVVVGIGAIIAFVGGGALYTQHHSWPFFLGAIVLMVTVLCLMSFIREPKTTTTIKLTGLRTQFSTILHDHPMRVAFVGMFFVSLAISPVETWLSSYGRYVLGLEPARTAQLTGISGGAFLLGALPGGLLGKWLGSQRLIRICGLLLGMIFSLGLIVQTELQLIGLLFGSGLMTSIIVVNVLPMLYNLSAGGREGAIAGTHAFMVQVAAAIGPQLVGFLIDLTGGNYRVLFLFSATSLLISNMVLMVSRQQKVAREESHIQVA